MSVELKASPSLTSAVTAALTSLATFLTKATETVDEVKSALVAGKEAAKAYAQESAGRRKLACDPEVESLTKDVLLAELRDKKSQLGRKKQRLENEVKSLEAQRQKLLKEAHGTSKKELKKGSEAVAQPPSGGKSLTHRMDLTGVRPVEVQAAPQPEPIAQPVEEATLILNLG